MGEFEQSAAEQSGEKVGDEVNEKHVPRHYAPPLNSASLDGARDRRDDTGSQLPLWPARAGEEGSSADAGAPSELAAAEPVEPAWTLTDLGAFALFVFVVSLPAAFLGTAGVFLLLRKAFGWDLTVMEAYTRAPLIVAMQTGWEVLWIGFIYFTITVKYRRQFWDALRWKLGAHRPRNWLAAGAVLALVAQLYFFFSPTGKTLPIEQLFSSPGAGYSLAFFGILVAPFVEEMVLRGFIYPVFERMWGLAAAVLLTALLFAVIHASQLWGGWEEIAAIFLVGVAFSYSRGKTGSLVPSYLMHVGYNTALFVLLFLSTDGFRTLRE